jgi:hypothetical protein
MTEYRLREAMQLLLKAEKHYGTPIELRVESGVLHNGRWWREMDRVHRNIQGDNYAISVDLEAEVGT